MSENTNREKTAISGIASLFSNTRLKRPLLVEWINALDLSDGRIEFYADEFSYILPREELGSMFRRSRSLLNGKNTIEEICKSNNIEKEQPLLEFLVQVLTRVGILVEGCKDNSSYAFGNNQKQLSFLSQTEVASLTNLDALNDLELRTFGPNWATSIVNQALSISGFKSVRSYETPAELDKLSTETIKAGNYFYIIVSNEENDELKRVANDWSIRTGNSWLNLTLGLSSGTLGPYYVPFQTGCHKCLNSRYSTIVKSHRRRDYPLEAKFIKAPPVTSSPLHNVIASLASIEILKLVTGFAPPTIIGGFHEFSLSQIAAETHTFLRWPNCSVCSNSEKTKQIWASAINEQ